MKQDGFDLWARQYDADVEMTEGRDDYPFAGYRGVLNQIYKQIREAGDTHVLDLGFGTAVLAQELYDNGHQISGMDFSSEMLRIASEKMPNARLIQADMLAGLPAELKQDSYDAVVCTYAIHHLDDSKKQQLIDEILDVLNPGGTLYIGDVAFETDRDMELCRIRSGQEWDDEEHYIVFDRFLETYSQASFDKHSHCAGVIRLRR